MALHSAGCGPERPGARLRAYAGWSLGLSLLFCLTYFGTNWIAAQRATRLRLYFPFEAAAPFVPWMAYVYASVNGLLLLPLFVLDRKGIGRLGRAFAAATLVAAGFHLAVPADLGWERHAADEQRLLAAIYAVDRPHNLFPSLHVAYSTLAALAVWRSGRAAWVRAGAAVWLAALAASVVLVRQHHLMDVAGGLWLGAAGAGAFGLGQPRNSEKRPLPH